MKIMKRIFQRKKGTLSASTPASTGRMQEEQSCLNAGAKIATNSAPPSINEMSVPSPKKNGTAAGTVVKSKKSHETKTSVDELRSQSTSVNKKSEYNPGRKTLSGVDSSNERNSDGEDCKHDNGEYVDTDSDDAELLPCERSEYKGVSKSFRGLNATEPFEEIQTEIDGRLASISDAYDAIPLLEQTKLPRGGISMETKAIGRIQFGIPPETIKDSMRLGIPVPQVYIVPAERFCREMGPALGVNLAEFEFPAYFNFFVYKKQCTLVVDSQDAQDNICRVFEETLLGPRQFRRDDNPKEYEEEDFSPDFPKDAIPNFAKELGFFRILGDGSELTLEKLLTFCQFKQPKDGCSHDNLGVPPNMDRINDGQVNDLVEQEFDEAVDELTIPETDEDDGELVPKDELEILAREDEKADWSYGRARWVGDVATVWPTTASDEQIKNGSVPRVEIFKMPSGTEYIIHDIDENNHIIGKARFSGHVKVSESMSVEGFGGRSILDDSGDLEGEKTVEESFDIKNSPMIPSAPPSFHPPSFGVTILGNSHGFDASGSVSGYVLWINGRGVMIDPPPYSSATLEREGIRPRTIVGIVLTHTHADHDAGAFQKVLTGSPVVVITTPTIYKSFIRKYAALASLSPALLRHSHRYKPAIIGQPLRFQGATFHFFYSLHAIPCVGFRVEWRGRSMVFTGDHMNKPDSLDKLQANGVLSKARADDLRNMPLQETDLLLHEAGAPPIHTPLEVLQKLPQRVKKRMYVVHTSSIPKEFDLRVAPTGTAGTLRLDQLQRGGHAMARIGVSTWIDRSTKKPKSTRDAYSIHLEDDELITSAMSSASNEYVSFMESETETEVVDEKDRYNEQRMMETSFAVQPGGHRKVISRSSIVASGRESAIPLVSLRPGSSTDAWFILNLLSAVPFLSSLSYSSTMEVLETARVDAYCYNAIVVPAARRSRLLCVVWEGTCVERDKKLNKLHLGENLALIEEDEQEESEDTIAVWHAGDWTGPIVLQPDKSLSGESDHAHNKDVVAMSTEGVKVITIDFPSLHNILMSGSPLYRKYLERHTQQQRRLSYAEGTLQCSICTATEILLAESLKSLNVLDLLDQNSALRKLSAVQKRHLESLAEGPIAFNPGERLWRAGAPVDRAYLVVAGTASFVPRRRNAGSASVPPGSLVNNSVTMLNQMGTSNNSLADVDEMGEDVKKAVEEMGEVVDKPSAELVTNEDEGQIQLESLFSRSTDGRARSMTEAHDFAKLSKTLKKRAESLTGHGSQPSDVSVGSSHDDASQDSESHIGSVDVSEDNGDPKDRRPSLIRRRSSRARFANKVLGRLYSRRAFTGGLVFSRGHFLGDASKMVAGLFTTVDLPGDQSFPVYGFGDKTEGTVERTEQLSDMVIHEADGDSHVVHTSTLTAGKEGCIVLVFPKSTLIPFLDDYPGLLLSLLGTQVVV